MLQRAGSDGHSWWWASHIRTKQSKWLDGNLRGQSFFFCFSSSSFWTNCRYALFFFFFFLCMNHVELFFPNTMQRHTYELIVAEFKDKKNGNNLILLEL
ncbi:hypothetical protein GW17_00004040 [Ensete ventricosum]|nr:hypothetical protein GW17_00004040 [Ensete ventricosum]